MKILFLSTWFPYPPDNGSKIRANYLLRALSRRHEVVLAAFDREWRDKEAGVLETGRIVDGVKVYAVPADPFRYVNAPQWAKFVSPIPLACWPSRMMRRVVHRAAAEADYDAVIASQMPVAYYAPLAGKMPRVLDIDISLGYERYQAWLQTRGAVQRFRYWLSWQKTRRYEWHWIKQFDACTVAAPEELEFNQQTFLGAGTPFHLTENGVDCAHNGVGLAPKIPGSLVYSGALTYSANFDAVKYFLADVYPLIRNQETGVSLTVTGSTAGVNLKGLSLDESVRFSGYVADVRPIVAGASVCVVPIRQGGGTRIKILEAMALGTPVVATSKGAEGLDVTPGHDILIADEPAEFAAQVVRLLHHGAVREQLSTNARRLVEQRYDWAEIGGRFVNLVEGVAQGYAPTGSPRP